jgi:hypothetical protein
MDKNADFDLRAYVVWVPKVGGREKDVPNATRFVADARARHYWDGEGILLRGYGPVLSISQDAWDIYMIYGPNAVWAGDRPPEPDYWMHQLDVSSQPTLDGRLFAEKVKQFQAR